MKDFTDDHLMEVCENCGLNKGGIMQHYPDLLNNPDNDPRITQQQYEDWHREQEEREEDMEEEE